MVWNRENEVLSLMRAKKFKRSCRKTKHICTVTWKRFITHNWTTKESSCRLCSRYWAKQFGIQWHGIIETILNLQIYAASKQKRPNFKCNKEWDSFAFNINNHQLTNQIRNMSSTMTLKKIFFFCDERLRFLQERSPTLTGAGHKTGSILNYQVRAHKWSKYFYEKIFIYGRELTYLKSDYAKNPNFWLKTCRLSVIVEFKFRHCLNIRIPTSLNGAGVLQLQFCAL